MLSGITRRVDGLGRVIIPKEIRKKMHINNGELIEFFLNNENEIIIKKHSSFNIDSELLNILVKEISNKINAQIYITNLNKIIISSSHKNIGEKIIINEEEISEKSIINITNNLCVNYPYKIMKINNLQEKLGYIICDYQNDDKKNDDLMDFLKKIIISYSDKLLL